MSFLGYRGRESHVLRTVARWLLIVAGLGFGMPTKDARAQGGGASEYALKAAIIGKFPRFVKWPSGGGSTIGILGDDPFGSELDGLPGIKVKRGRRVEDLRGCQIIFVSKSERANVAAILSSLAGANTLTVGDSDGFARQGGVVGFKLVGDKVRFVINLGAAQRNGLTIDPQLADLAAEVIKK